MGPFVALLLPPPELPEASVPEPPPLVTFEGGPLESVVPMYPVLPDRGPHPWIGATVVLGGVTGILVGALFANHPPAWSARVPLSCNPQLARACI